MSGASNLAPMPPNMMNPNHHNPSIAPSVSPFGGAHNASFIQPPAQFPAQSALSLHQSRIEPPPLHASAGIPMPGTLPNPIHGPKKRLILTCDGTWLDENNSVSNSVKHPASNVARLGWAIKESSRDGIPQVVNYQAGIGTAGTKVSRVLGGAIGAGIKEIIRDGYSYLATNWREGDDIILIGFSRGAFTVRSIGGLIGDLGLLTRKGLPFFNEIFEDYEHKSNDNYNSPFPDIPFHKRGPFDERYVHELERLGMTRRRIPIKAICCYDTVGGLGIPRAPLLRMVPGSKDYQFDDTKISPCVENAFQALALDEHRAPFSPALWEKAPDQATNLKQVWFPGVHSNIGGGYADQEIANIVLAWMMSRLEPFLDFRSDFLVSQLDEQRKFYKESGQRNRWWSFGEIYRSMKGIYSLTGQRTRTPGAYQRLNPITGRSTGKRLKNTNEYIHASVRARVGLKGPGPQDRGDYNPPALADWTFEPEPVPPGAAQAGAGGNLTDNMQVVWNYRGGDRDGQTRIPEAVLLDTELALLRQFQAVDDYIRHMRPPGKEKRRSKRYANGNGNADVHVNGGGAAMPGGFPGGRRRSLGGDRPPVPDDFAVPEDDDRRRRHRRRTRAPSQGPVDVPVDDSDDSERKERERAERHERRKKRMSAKY